MLDASSTSDVNEYDFDGTDKNRQVMVSLRKPLFQDNVLFVVDFVT